MHRALFCILIIFNCYFSAYAQPGSSTISDSLDITHITVKLKVTDYAGKTLQGNAEIQFTAKVNGINTIPLDFISLEVDSVIDSDGNAILFSADYYKLNLQLASALNTGDEFVATVYYHGAPQQLGSFGGWYWSGTYSYQLGVSLDTIPHNAGRVWFPCFDNFVERSTFRFEITTQATYKAFCGGLLENEITNADGTTTWIWNLNQTIPAYLASVAVNEYATVNMLYNGIDGDIPIQLGAKASDTTAMKNALVNIQNALAIYENYFGPYRWDRVGYVETTAGFMEHTMNIASPYFALGFANESYFMHELSHQWFGDLVTCASAEDMWLNEGWADFSKRMFDEFQYGEQQYKQEVKENHTEVLRYAHATDGNNYLPLSGMPQQYTYGATTYNKGSDVVFTLRNYLGDTLFYNCVKQYLDAFAFNSASSAQLRDFLSDCSGINITDFFSGWVFNAGFPGFEIEHIERNASDEIISVCLQQKLNHAPAYFNNVPLTLNFVDAYGINVYEQNIIMSGENMTFSVPGVNAKYVIIDRDEKISDATTEDEIIIKTPGTYILQNAFVDIFADGIATGDSAWIRIENHFTAADTYKIPVSGLHVNSQRYWKVEGYIPPSFSASVKFTFNGKLSISDGYLDNEFLTTSDDSVVLLYRPSADAGWEIYPYATLNVFGSTTDKFGAFFLSVLSVGEYALGQYNHSIPDDAAYISPSCSPVNIDEGKLNDKIKIFPNPAQDYFSVQIDNSIDVYEIFVFDSTGKKIKNIVTAGNKYVEVPLQDFATGLYAINFFTEGRQIISSQKMLIIR